MNAQRAILLIVVIILNLTACTQGIESGVTDTQGTTHSEAEVPLLFTSDDYPKVDGSTATIPLSEAVFSALTHTPADEAKTYILHHKTHKAYLNLVDGNADLIFVTAPSTEELEYAAAAGVTLEVIPVVSEAFVFLVNVDNPVSALTVDEIRGIYTGEITNWSEVGGRDGQIIPYQRPVNSGSQTGFLNIVMNGEKPMEAPMEQVIAEMGELIDSVADYDNSIDAIGYSYYYFASDMWGRDQIKFVSVDGIEPTTQNISNGQYPFDTAYYAVIRSDEPEESSARQIIEWLLSEDGQNIAEEAGYVKIQ